MFSRASSERLANLDRREFLGALALALAGGGCRRWASREEALARLIDQVVAPDLLELEQRSRDLSRAAERLAVAPDFAELRALRACFRRAALAWKRASAFRLGPLLESQALARAAYWPARSAAVSDLLASERAPSALLLAELGCDVKGLYALEYLLFTRVAEPQSFRELSESEQARLCALARAYSDDIALHAEVALRALGHGSRGYAARFSRAGQSSLSQLAGLLAEGVENQLAARLELVAWLASLQRLRSIDVEGGASQISHELALAGLVGGHRLYASVRGAGLADLVERSAPQVHAHLQRAFASAISELRLLAAPLEAVAIQRPNQLRTVLRTVKTLELALKEELPSALGVTLSFTALDAD